MSNLKTVLQQNKQLIDRTMQEILDKQQVVSATLQEAMEYSLFSGGKRIRPILCLLSAELCRADRAPACQAGCALEFIHTYSLIHDDLPEMDDDDYRRGKPSNHKVYGPGIAILAGDGLLTLAFNVLAGLDLPPARVRKIMLAVSQGAGPAGMVGGQVLDLQGENSDLSCEQLQNIHSNKTAALITGSVLAGAHCGRPRQEELQALEKYAHNLGLLFQITDDILDVTGDSAKLGKAAGSDRELNKTTYPSLLGLEGARSRAREYADTARRAVDIFGEKATTLTELVDFVLHREY